MEFSSRKTVKYEQQVEEELGTVVRTWLPENLLGNTVKDPADWPAFDKAPEKQPVDDEAVSDDDDEDPIPKKQPYPPDEDLVEAVAEMVVKRILRGLGNED